MSDWFASPQAAQLGGLFVHFLMLSLLAVGGAISTAPDMHRYLVVEQGWLSDAQFTSSIALAQAAPGPNVTFVAVLGYNVAGLPGAAATLLGIMLPSTTLAFWATRFSRDRRETLAVRAFTAGMAPLTVGLLMATGWLLAEPAAEQVGALVLVVVTAGIAWQTRIGPIWLVAVGAFAGVMGWA
jgi:chromate transporter